MSLVPKASVNFFPGLTECLSQIPGMWELKQYNHNLYKENNNHL